MIRIKKKVVFISIFLLLSIFVIFLSSTSKQTAYAAHSGAFDPIVLIENTATINGTPCVEKAPKKEATTLDSLSISTFHGWQETPAFVLDFSTIDKNNFAIEFWLYVDKPMFSMTDTPFNFKFEDAMATSEYTGERFMDSWILDTSDLQIKKWNKVSIKYNNNGTTIIGANIGKEFYTYDDYRFVIWQYAYSEFYIHNLNIVHNTTEQSKVLKVIENDDLLNITANATSINLETDGTNTFAIVPENKEEKTIEYTYSSSNNSIATVDTNGNVTGVNKGKCEIIISATLENHKYVHSINTYVRTNGDKLDNISVISNDVDGVYTSMVESAPPSSDSRHSIRIAAKNGWYENISKQIDLRYAKTNFILQFWVYGDKPKTTGDQPIFFRFTESGNKSVNNNDKVIGQWITYFPAKITTGKWNKVSINLNLLNSEGIANCENVDIFNLTFWQNAYDTFYMHNVEIVPSYTQTEQFKVIDIEESFNLKLDYKSLTLAVGDEFTLDSFTISKSQFNNPITWTVDKPSVLSVDSFGKINALTPGEAILTAKCSSMGIIFSSSCNILVKKAPAAVNINISSTSGNVNDYINLSASINPLDSFGEIHWVSSDVNLAVVDQYGQVILKSEGEVTISAISAKNSLLKANCVIKILPKTVANAPKGCGIVAFDASMMSGGAVLLLLFIVMIVARRRKGGITAI